MMVENKYIFKFTTRQNSVTQNSKIKIDIDTSIISDTFLLQNDNMYIINNHTAILYFSPSTFRNNLRTIIYKRNYDGVLKNQISDSIKFYGTFEEYIPNGTIVTKNVLYYIYIKKFYSCGSLVFENKIYYLPGFGICYEYDEKILSYYAIVNLVVLKNSGCSINLLEELGNQK